MVYEKHIELETSHLYLLEEGLTLLRAKNKVEFELKHAVEVDNLTYDLVKGKPFVAIVDGQNVRSNMSHAARDYFAKNEKITNIRKGQAIVVNSLHIKLLANFYMNFHKPSNPVKIFADYDKAYNWIIEIRNEWYK
ncbi:MAG: hypothetical protein QMB65_00295 [Vicingaceae bacterium]